MNRTRLIIASCLSASAFLAHGASPQTTQDFLQGRVYELRATASAPACLERASGLPSDIWGSSDDYGPETSMLFDNGQVLVLSAVHKASGEHVSHRFYKDKATCQQDLERKPETTSLTKTADGDGLTYVQRLQRDYGARLHFSSPQAKKVAGKINIDCRAMDGRYLPLHNALLARLDEASEPNAWMETRVVESGNNIKVYDRIHIKNGKAREPQLIFEVNEWGAVTQHGVRSDALEKACFGTYGPIWQF